MLLTSATAIEHPSATIIATKILDHVNNLWNAKVTDPSVSEITTSIRSLIDYCNTKFLEDLPIDFVYKPTNTLQIELKSWYSLDLNFTNIHEYVISTFENRERCSYQINTSNRCIDAICILIDHFNVVVLSRTDHYLKLQEKRLGEFQSPKSVETSIHLVNGDDYI